MYLQPPTCLAIQLLAVQYAKTVPDMFMKLFAVLLAPFPSYSNSSAQSLHSSNDLRGPLVGVDEVNVVAKASVNTRKAGTSTANTP